MNDNNDNDKPWSDYDWAIEELDLDALEEVE